VSLIFYNVKTGAAGTAQRPLAAVTGGGGGGQISTPGQGRVGGDTRRRLDLPAGGCSVVGGGRGGHAGEAMAEAAECVSGGGGGVDMGGPGRERGAADVKEEGEEEDSLVVYPTPSVTSFMALLSFVFLVQGALLAMLCYTLWLGQVANNIIAPPAAASAPQKQGEGGGGGGGGGGVLQGQCPQLFSAVPSEAAESVVGACLCFRCAVCSLTFPCFPFFLLVASPARMHCGTARRGRCYDCGHVFFFFGLSLAVLLSKLRPRARACVCVCVCVCMCVHVYAWLIKLVLVSCVHFACVVCTRCLCHVYTLAYTM
jgi:hypothetical protein